MAYEKTNWIDHVVDSETGEIIQQGTRFTAQRMNNIEKGIDDAHSELDELKGLDGKIKVELIPKEGLNVDQVDGLHVDDTNSGSSEEEKNALWSAKKVKEITDELGSQIGQITLQKSENKVTVFNANGSITEIIKNGTTTLRTKTTTFPSATQIVETTVENGVTTTKTTTFNTDGTIKEEVV